MAIKFDVINRWSGSVQFVAEIECAADALPSIKLGLAVRWAYRSDAVLSDAVLSDADLRDADLSGADLRGSLKGVPIVPHIDAAILAAVEGGAGKLDMGDWHRCETTHCRAGWAIHLAGAAGAALEFAMGPASAGSLIYAASRPGKPIPNFYCDNKAALADLRAGAAADPMPAEPAQTA